MTRRVKGRLGGACMRRDMEDEEVLKMKRDEVRMRRAGKGRVFTEAQKVDVKEKGTGLQALSFERE